MSYQLTELDRKIIRATQQGMELTVSPFATLANQLGEPVEVILDRIEFLQGLGVIRRVALVPNHYNVGYRFNGMTVWDVPDSEVGHLGKRVGAFPFVSHCYRRPRIEGVWDYNLFAMVHGKTKNECYEKYQAIEHFLKPHLVKHDVLFSKKVLKKTGFRI